MLYISLLEIAYHVVHYPLETAYHVVHYPNTDCIILYVIPLETACHVVHYPPRGCLSCCTVTSHSLLLCWWEPFYWPENIPAFYDYGISTCFWQYSWANTCSVCMQCVQSSVTLVFSCPYMSVCSSSCQQDISAAACLLITFIAYSHGRHKHHP